jgi:hypothetical protein
MAHYRTYSVGSRIELSGKVGESIDATELLDYDIFPSIEGFNESMFFKIPGRGYEIQIAAEDGRYIAVNRYPDGVEILKDYFVQYDPTHKDLSGFEGKWGVIGYDALGFPITQHEVSQGGRSGCSCIATAGCGVVSLGLSLLFAWGYGLNHINDADQSAVNSVCVGIVAGGTVVGVGAGYLAGRLIDRSRAFRAIENARKPIRVE